MKATSLFFLLFLSFSPIVNAQITRGNWLVGGNAAFSYSNSKSELGNGKKSTAAGYGFRLYPKICYFPMDKFAVGISLGLHHGKGVSGRSYSLWDYGLGPFLRYYFLPTDKLINVFGEAGYIFSTDLKGPSYNSDNIGLKAGAVLFFTGSVGLEVTLNYEYSKRNDAYGGSTSKWLSLGIGFQVHLGKSN